MVIILLKELPLVSPRLLGAYQINFFYLNIHSATHLLSYLDTNQKINPFLKYTNKNVYNVRLQNTTKFEDEYFATVQKSA